MKLERCKCFIYSFKKLSQNTYPVPGTVSSKKSQFDEEGLALRPFLTQKKAMCWLSESLGAKEAAGGSDLPRCYKSPSFPVLISRPPLFVTGAGWDQSAGAAQALGAHLKMRSPRYHL